MQQEMTLLTSLFSPYPLSTPWIFIFSHKGLTFSLFALKEIHFESQRSCGLLIFNRLNKSFEQIRPIQVSIQGLSKWHVITNIIALLSLSKPVNSWSLWVFFWWNNLNTLSTHWFSRLRFFIWETPGRVNLSSNLFDSVSMFQDKGFHTRWIDFILCPQYWEVWFEWSLKKGGLPAKRPQIPRGLKSFSSLFAFCFLEYDWFCNLMWISLGTRILKLTH